MGGQFSCHFCERACENSTFKKWICNMWCCGHKNNEKKRTEELRRRRVVYVNKRGIEQFVLLNTAFVEMKEWVLLDELPFNTFTMFFQDPEGRMRIVVHHEPHDQLHRISNETKSTTLLTTANNVENALPIREEKCVIHQGALVEDVLAPHLRAPIIKFMTDTLNGTYYQMHGMFNSTPKLIRTFPITNYNNTVVAGVMMIGCFTPSFDNDDQIKQFVLNTPVSNSHPEHSDLEESITDKNLHDELQNIPSTVHLGRRTSMTPKVRTL
jgi:hypothetical protein